MFQPFDSSRQVFILVPILGWLLSSPCHGGLIAYTSRPAFDAASSGVTAIDFESQAVGNVPSGGTLDGVTLHYSLGSVSARVIDSQPTTSGTKSLGTDDLDRFLDGDNLTFTFTPRSGFGLYVLTNDALLNGDFQLTVGPTIALLDASATQISLGGSRFAWFLGVQSDNGQSFTSATLSTHGGGGAFTYYLDDIVTTAVPEPSSLWMLMVAATISLTRRRPRIPCHTQSANEERGG